MKKLIVVLLIFLLIFSTTVFAKKRKRVKVVKHETFKEKIAVGVNAFDSGASMRFWISDSLGMDFLAGLGFIGGDNSNFIFNIGWDMVIPMYSGKDIYLNLLPGVSIGYNKDTVTVGNQSVDTGTFGFIAGVGIEFEAFLKAISPDLSISSQIGAGLGINSTSTGGNTSTSFTLGILNDTFINPIILRYYF